MSSEVDDVSEDELHAFVDGRLGEWRRTAVLTHLARHPDALARLARYAVHRDELRRRVEAADLPGDDPATLRLQRELADRLGRRSPAVVRLRHAAAIALLLGAGWWSNTLYHRYLQIRVPYVVAEAAQAHQVFGEDHDRPVELAAAARAEMVAWFTRQLGEPVDIPSLHAIGLRLVGGRLLAGGDGPVAQLIYEDRGGHRLTLALSSEPVDAGPEIEIVAVPGGLTAGYWRDGELAYAVVAETSEQELVAIASEIGAQEPRRLL